MALKYLPQGENLLSGVLSALLSDSATSATVNNPPASSKLPTYFTIEPDSDSNREVVRVTAVSGGTITIERGVFNGGTGKEHASNSAYKQTFTEDHWDAIVNAVEAGYLIEDSSLTVTRNSATQFQVEAIDNTAYYTAGRIVRFNQSDSDVGVVSSSTYSGSNTVVDLLVGSVPSPLNYVEIGIQQKGATEMLSMVLGASGAIYDNNKNEILTFSQTASAVNNLKITNAATGNPAKLEAEGGDTNIDMYLGGKGTGIVKKPSSLIMYIVEGATSVSTGDGKFYLTIPPEFDGMNLVDCHAKVVTAGTTGTTDIQIYNVTGAADMLTTKLTIDSGETGSDTAATAHVIDTNNDDVAENDQLRIDVDAVSTTAPLGLIVRLEFDLP